ncbi:MAG: HAMP domain-containing histidine kinase [Actinomycetota bacterium]|nr:HAMP domain-containing histidine kinase [Actinomycetota bacterium]
MSSSQQAERVVRRRPITLRTKLIASFVVAIVTVTVVIGVVTQVLLSDYLVKQLDGRVMQTQQRFGPDRQSNGADVTPGSTTDPAPPTQTGGVGRGALADRMCKPSASSTAQSTAPQPDNSVFATIKAGVVTKATLLVGFGPCDDITAQSAVLTTVAPGLNPVTVTLGNYGDFRVVAAQTQDGQVVVTGLSLADVKGARSNLAIIMAIVAAAAVVLGGVAVWLIIRRSLRPLEQVAATARKVTTLQLDKGVVDLGIRVPDRDTDPRTEVGQVGAALNQMLGHVSGALNARQDSETRVRRFVADASHELRTPLAAIRGYAELAGRNPDDAPAVRHALGRVRSQSERMTTLVDDLLLLARLDSGRPLGNDPVDLTRLAIDAVSDARAAGADHRWQLDLPSEPVTVVGDGHRLHQVLANLLANARTHTPSDSVVVTGLRTERKMAVLTVTDDGEGIPEAMQSEIFGRFVRGDSSRSRAAGSTGLGLAIVSAVTGAHGGTVAVKSRPGHTVFTVRLPIDAGRSDGPVDDDSGGGAVTNPAAEPFLSPRALARRSAQ